MSLIRWNPWNLSSLMEEDWDLPTLPGLSRLGQGLNIYETQDNIVAEASVPGVKENDLDITFEDGVVRISGSTTQEVENKDQRRYFMSSRASSFNYSFRLPTGIVSEDEPECELEDGVLTLTFKKVQKVAPKKITVKAKKTKEDRV